MYKRQVKGSLKIGASLTIGEYILPKFLAIFSKKYPDVDIEVIIENTALISSELKKFKLYIGLIEGAASSSLFKQEYFLHDDMVLAIPYTCLLYTSFQHIYTSEEAFFNNFEKQQKFIKETTGSDCTIFRFPGGSHNTIVANSRGKDLSLIHIYLFFHPLKQ